MSKKVLFIVGSLRQGSFNHQMALEAEKALAGKAEVSYLDYSALPLFSQDLEVPTYPAVANAGHDQLFAIYKDLLPFIRTQGVGDFTAARVNDSAWADGKLVLEETVLNSLEKQAQDLVEAIK
ncbi:NADPH-dependent FMN reductase, putative [Streptococcus pneumoniae]|nr:NADPH-dependent FMN reductase, putative [Streptococcus pneumoniae]